MQVMRVLIPISAHTILVTSHLFIRKDSESEKHL